MPPHQTPTGLLSTTDVLLTALGKTWGRLLPGNILEVRRGELVVQFDLGATAALGRPVVCQAAHELAPHEELDLCASIAVAEHTC